MAAGDRVQVGVQWMHGFQSFAITGYMPESITDEFLYDLEDMQGVQKETVTKIGTNPRREIVTSLFVKGTVAIADLPVMMDIISITPTEGGSAVKFFVNKSVPSYSNDKTKLSLNLVREDSMAATYDA